VADAVGNLLLAELDKLGFAPDDLLTKLVGSRIGQRGEDEFQIVSARFPDVGDVRPMFTHHLGIGASMTEFLIAGLALHSAMRAQVASLGGIAHTIYALFDSLLDVSGCVPELFSNQSPVVFGADTHKQELLIRLVGLYFERLNSMSGQATKIRALLERTIHKLHKAELESSAPGEITRQAWWRKNALPLVVMALPGWLFATDLSNIRFTEHLLWLCRVGDFLGWLDDFSDFEKDSASGQANRLKQYDPTLFPNLARQAAIRGQRALQLWDLRNSNPLARNTFTVIAWTSLAQSKRELPYEPRASEVHVSGSLQ
jgi:hypothetical protein